MQRTRTAISCFVLVGLICLGIFLHRSFFEPNSNEVERNIETEFDSPTSINSEVSSSQNPLPQPAEVIDDPLELTQGANESDVSENASESFHTPLEGVELTEFRGEMKKGKLAQRPFVDVATHPSLPWFTKDASAIKIPASEENLERDDFFAWVQLNPNHLHKLDLDNFKAFQTEIFEGGSEYRRARLPRSSKALEKLLEGDEVLALGIQPVSEKIGPNFLEEISSGLATDTKAVYITLMTSADVSHWQDQITDHGAVIDHWDPTIRVLVAIVPLGKLLELAERDFVAAIEPIETLELMLENAIPVGGADAVRTHLPVNGSFTGLTGENVTIGVIDTGLNLSHPDISATRDSICGESFLMLANGQPDIDDLWVDVGGHGTHVTGIFAGAGVDDRNRAGFAPGVKHIRFAKSFAKDSPFASMSAILKSIDYLTQESSCEWNNIQSVASKPNVVNMSLGASSADAGYSTDARKLDWASWSHDQLYVVAQGNNGAANYSNLASAKNSLSVGWLTDSLIAHPYSSHGPSSDGRMIPKVSMTGHDVWSADSNGAEFGYIRLHGTSMAAPAVAGIAAILMDTDEAFKTSPALVRAQIMATAIKADHIFEDEPHYPRSNTNGPGHINDRYGMGYPSARTATTQGPNEAWSSHSVLSEIENDEYAYVEIEIPEGTDRVDIVLTWDEPPNDIAGPPVMADLDLYLGPNNDCDVTECGEYVSSSRVDNLEYLIVSNPESGTKRITVIPHNIYQFTPRIAVAWMTISQSRPELSIELDSDTMNVANTRRPRLDFSVSAEGFVASGVTLYLACKSESSSCDYLRSTDSRWQPGSQILKEDGTVQDLAGITTWGEWHAALYLGEISPNEVQDITLVFPPGMQNGNHQIYFAATSANALSAVEPINVITDDETMATLEPAIVNNYATNAIEMSGESGTVTVNLLAGARQPGEIHIDDQVLWLEYNKRGTRIADFWQFVEGKRLSRSAWFKISTEKASKYGIRVTNKNPSNGEISFQLLSTNAPLTPVFQRMWVSSRFGFYVEPHREYYLRVTSYDAFAVSEVEFVWEKLDTKPENDLFDDRTKISGANGGILGNNAYATVERGEPGAHVYVGSTWYEWEAPSDGVWSFQATAPHSHSKPPVTVYQGSFVNDLRLVSDSSHRHPRVPVSAGEEYQICVSAETFYTDYKGSYELLWSVDAESSLMVNDLMENATTLSGSSGQSSKCDPCNFHNRTIETDEPIETNTHSLWWQWEAPFTSKFTFRLANAQYDSMSLFEGTNVSTLTHEGSGSEIVLDARSGETYYLSIHRQPGLNFLTEASENSFEWGITPEYDRINNPVILSGTSGTESLNMKYATTTADESRANGLTSVGVHSSVWGSWSTPTNFDGWMRFSVESWQEAGLSAKTDQHFLGIHERDEDSNSWNRVASTDRSFILSGKPHAVFKPEARKEYLVQVALRSNSKTFDSAEAEAEVSWEQTGAPPWLMNELNFVEIGSATGHNIDNLIDPTAGTIVGRNLDKLLLTLPHEMLLLQLQPDSDDLNTVETIPYQNDSETVPPLPSVVSWNTAREVLYSVDWEGFGIHVMEGLDQSERAFSSCEIKDYIAFPHEPTKLLSESSGRYLYLITPNLIATYRLDGPCEVTLIQFITATDVSHDLNVHSPDLEGLNDATFGPDENYLYGMSNSSLLTFNRDADSGELQLLSNTEHQILFANSNVSAANYLFNGAQITLDSSGDYLFAIGSQNPAVAIIDLATDRERPKSLAISTHYYVNGYENFQTHILLPYHWNTRQCHIKEVHHTENPTVDVFCRHHYFVATWDKDIEQLYISDWASHKQPDRFGNRLPALDRVSDAFSVSAQNGQFTYLVVEDWIDSIHRFERVTGPKELQPKEITPYDTYILRLVAMDVAPGEIELGSRLITTCEAISNLEIDEVTYTVENSKWQVRDQVGDEWTDVTGTVRSDNQLCPYDPTDSRDYRLAFNATVDGNNDDYSSDVMSKQE